MIILSAILMAISQHPIGYGFLAFFSIIPIIPFLIKLKSYHNALWNGFLWGFTYNFFTVFWIATNIGTTQIIAFITMILSVLILSVTPMIIFFLWCALNRRKISLLFLSFVWPSVELIRSYGSLGFPWVSISNSLVEYNNIIQLIEYIGMYGLSALIILINILIYNLILTRNLKSILVLFLTLSLSILIGVLIKTNFELDKDKDLKVAVIQPNIHLSDKWSRGSQSKIMNKIISHSQETLIEKPDLLVWPETSVISYLIQRDKYNYNKIKSLLDGNTTKLIAGIPYYDSSNNKIRYYNSSGYFDGSGLIGLYHKIHLVPGAEYVPFSKYLNSLEIFNFGMGNFSHGQSYELFDVNDYKFAAMICLESIFPHLSRKFVADGANFLIYLVNDGWYESAPEPQQHASRAIYRAIETRRPIIRCANTGVSMIIDQLGNITHQLELNNKGNIVEEINPSTKMTFYVKYGDIFIYFMMLSIMLLLFKKVRYEDYI